MLRKLLFVGLLTAGAMDVGAEERISTSRHDAPISQRGSDNIKKIVREGPYHNPNSHFHGPVDPSTRQGIVKADKNFFNPEG